MFDYDSLLLNPEGIWLKNQEVLCMFHITYEFYYMKEEEFGPTYSSLILQISLELKRMDRTEYSNGSKI